MQFNGCHNTVLNYTLINFFIGEKMVEWCNYYYLTC